MAAQQNWRCKRLKIVPYIEMQELSLTIHYNRMDELTKILSQIKGQLLDKQFDSAVHVKVRLPASERLAFMSRFS